ncbi:MAG: CotH kinase family protein, partial [Deltaproteobacteria bacterium]|nr:CotH kinase family protein [Deltaproteobacteria bacterium]
QSTELRVVATDPAGAAQLSFAGLWLFAEGDAASFSTDLPLLLFWTRGEVPQEKSELYTSFSMLVLEPSAGGRVVFPAAASVATRAGLKIRGSSSAWYPKLPWRLELWDELSDDDRELPLLGLPAESDWALGAPLDFDRALMRTSLAYQLSRDAGRYAPRTQHVEVFILGEGGALRSEDYVGVYELTETVKRDADRVAVTRIEPGDVAYPAVTGGYLFKEDRTGPDEAGFTAGTADGALWFQQPFVWVTPTESELAEAQRVYLVGLLDDLGRALTSPGFLSPTSGLHYSAILDTDSFIDHHILNVFAKNPDALRLSGYFHKDRLGLLAAGPLWDFDRTMGCASDDRAADPTWWDATNVTSDTTDMFHHGFFGGLFTDPAFRAAYFARMDELLAGPLAPAHTHALLDAWADQLAEAHARNFARWSDYGPRGTFDDEVQLLKDWLAERHGWMSACLALPDPMDCTGD